MRPIASARPLRPRSLRLGSGLPALALGLSLVATGAGCGLGTGELSLALDLPDDAPFRPDQATTVTVVARPLGQAPLTTISVLEDGTFRSGDLPVGVPLDLSVELHDARGRLVGVGLADDAILLDGNGTTNVRIAVRRPYLFAVTDTVTGIDLSRDPRDDAFWTGLDTSAGVVRAIAVNGDTVIAVQGTRGVALATETLSATGDELTFAAPPTDLVALPDGAGVAVGDVDGVQLVMLDGQGDRALAMAPVDRLAISRGTDGHIRLAALHARVAPPAWQAPCTGTSSVTLVDLTDGSERTLPAGVGLADVAITDAGRVVATAPCTGQVVELDEGGARDLAPLPSASDLVQVGATLWAAGEVPAVVQEDGGSITFVIADAFVQLVAFDTRDGELVLSRRETLAARRQSVLDLEDDALQHTQDMRPYSAAVRELTALPGGERLAFLARYAYAIGALPDTDDPTLLLIPRMEGGADDLVVFDTVDATVTTRLRARCDLEVDFRPDAVFPDWACAAPPPEEEYRDAPVTPTALGALYGAQ